MRNFECVGPRAGNDGVITVRGNIGIIPGTTRENIIAGIAFNRIPACTARNIFKVRDRVGARPISRRGAGTFRGAGSTSSISLAWG